MQCTMHVVGTIAPWCQDLVHGGKEQSIHKAMVHNTMRNGCIRLTSRVQLAAPEFAGS